MPSDDGINRRFGLVLFDDPTDPTSGWIAVGSGATGKGTPPSRINGINELSTDVIWWTNVQYGDFFRGKVEIWRNPWLRHDKYLVVGPSDVLKEWGHDPKLASADFVVAFVAEVYSRIMHRAYELVRRTDPKLRMDKLFEGKTLRDDLRRLFPDPEYPQGEAATMMKSGQAYEEFTAANVRTPKGARYVRLRKPRISYCWEMLQTPFPAGPYEFMGRSDLSAKQDERVAFVLKSQAPVMAEVTVSDMQPEVAPVYGFGSSTDKDKRVQRSWVAQPEFIMLSRYAKVDVRAAWVGREYQPLMPEMPEAVVDFLKDKINNLSWSAGIVAETLWRAAALPQEKGKAGTKDSGEKPHTSWRGAWIKAADKSAMFMEAMRMTELGYAVPSYGLGWLFCAVADEDVGNLIRDAATLGMVPLLVDVPERFVDYRQPLRWGGEPLLFPTAHGTHSRAKTYLWNLDRLAIIQNQDQRVQMMMKLMTSFQKGEMVA